MRPATGLLKPLFVLLGLLSAGLLVAVAQPTRERALPDARRPAALGPEPGGTAERTGGGEQKRGQGGDQVVVRFRGGQITVGDAQAAIANKAPSLRRNLAGRPAQVALLRAMVDYDLLVREAERRGYAFDPVVRERAARVAVEAMAAELAVAPTAIPQARVQARLREAGSGDLGAPESVIRQALAEEAGKAALEAVATRQRQSHPVEIHPELLAAIALPTPAPGGLPAGVPAAPDDPRAPTEVVEPDDF